MRDSHGLFDYESRNISKKNVRTGMAGRIVRTQDEIEFIVHERPSERTTILTLQKENSKQS